jgi:peptide/nickel transport system permease protein
VSTFTYILRRLGVLVLTLLAASFVIYGAVYLSPGTPLAAFSGGRSLPPAAVKALSERFHLSDPFLVQYWHWLTGALHGDLGYSIVHQQSVSSLIKSELPITIELIAFAALLTVLFGILIGTIGALKPGPIDDAVLGLTAGSAAMPAFVAAFVLITVFAINLGWFPAEGDGSGFVDRIHHLTLPALSLSVTAFALVARVVRTSQREQLGREHVQTAVSRAVPYWAIVRRHVFRNAAIPIVTTIGVVFATLIALDPVVEDAFNLSGIGSTLVQDALQKDLPTVQGVCLLLVSAFVVINMLVDVSYRFLDPRLRGTT